MTDAVMFNPEGNNILPARVLYKKNILVLRGSFRPVTKVNIDMFKKSYDIFINLMILPVNLIFLRKNKLIENISQPIGTIKFILFLLFR